MPRIYTAICLVLSAWMLSATLGTAERLALDFLPPDIPPDNICNIPEAEITDATAQVDTLAQNQGSQAPLEEYLGFLQRDIRNLMRDDADGTFDYIGQLIAKQAALDPEFDSVKQDFARIDLYVAAGRFDALRDSGIVPALATQTDALNNNEKVQLAQFYLVGIGVAPDRDIAAQLLTDAAFAGNANALFALVRLHLAGQTIDGWTLPLEETAKMAFGGMIGQMNRGICDRAERMAREYLDGEILVPNPDLAFAWRKFAADLGGQDAAWRVVEHYLNATTQDMNNDALRHYISLAVGNSREITAADIQTVLERQAVTENEVRVALGYTQGRAELAQRRSAVPYLDLELDLNRGIPPAEGPYLKYLRDIVAIPGAPGSVHTRLAREIILKHGVWAAEAEVSGILETAVSLGDPDAMMLLARLLSRHRDDPDHLNRTVQLYLDAVTQRGHAPAMKALDDLYRCRHPAAPMHDLAGFWADAYRMADIGTIGISATDLAKLDSASEPELVAKIQSLALDGQGSAIADFLQYLQSDPLVPDETLRFWAARVSSSDRALEDFVRQELELALTPGQRQDAIELFRRAYLDISAAITLDMAVALIEHAGRNPETAEEVRALLTQAGQRGEGAAIRLLQRLTQADGAEIYREFQDVIESNGDFLALMFAAPYVADSRFDDYMDRAVSVMNCNSKDIAELADAHAIRGRDTEAMHWLRVGLAIEGGNVLSRLGLSDWQIDYFDSGAAVSFDTAQDMVKARRRAYLLAADPNGSAYDPDAAADHLTALLDQSDPAAISWALTQYRKATRAVQRGVEAGFDILSALETAAASGDHQAQYDLAMSLRARAENTNDLATSSGWLLRAAKAGHTDAMVDYAFALGFGLGQPADPKSAVIWLQKAQSFGNLRSRDLIRIFTAMTQQ